jgi:CRP/FNR family transcriptional regulator, cyclic AMP receptor protein
MSMCADTKILLIEDDVDNCEVTSLVLEQHFGVHVSTANNGCAGLSRALSEHPEVIVCDYSMPCMNGAAFVRKARQQQQLREIPIVLYSAEPALAQLADTVDADAFVSKSDSSRLVDEVEHLLHRRRHSD